ncbi:patatin-like phospholipase family protein [Pseudomonas aeruginosa]
MNFSKQLSIVTRARKSAFHDVMCETTINKLATFARDNWRLLNIYGINVFGKRLDEQNPENSLEDINTVLVDVFLGHETYANAVEMQALEQELQQTAPYQLEKLTAFRWHFQHIVGFIRDARERKDLTDDEMEQLACYTEHLNRVLKETARRAIDFQRRLNGFRNDDEPAPEVLVLQGGGAKGMSYAGCVKELEDRNQLKGLKYVAGTSAGALIGVLVAMGCSGDEVQKIVAEGRFAQFYAEGSSSFNWAKKTAVNLGVMSVENDPGLEGILLKKFASQYLIPELTRVSGISYKQWISLSEDILQQRLREVDTPWQHENRLDDICNEALKRFNEDLRNRGMESLVGVLDFATLGKRSKGMQCALTCVRVRRLDKSKDGDSIEAYIGDVIQTKISEIPIVLRQLVEPELSTVTQIRNMTFDQLRQLISIVPEEYGLKNFGVGISDSRWVLFGVKPVTARAGGGQYVDMPIKKAVRASMNLPYVFKHIRHEGKYLRDGGLTNNFPISIWEDMYASPEEYRDKMRGFMLSTLDHDVEARLCKKYLRDRDVIKLHAVEMLTKIPKQIFNQSRSLLTGKAFGRLVEYFMELNKTSEPDRDDFKNIAFISTGTIGTAAFNIDKRERLMLGTAGYMASSFLNSLDYDPKLRSAMTRMTGLAKIEARLIEKIARKKGLPENDNSLAKDPIFSANNHDDFMHALKDSKFRDGRSWDVMIGV